MMTAAATKMDGEMRQQKVCPMTVIPAELRQRLEGVCGDEIRWQENLAPYTTLQVGGPAWAVIFPTSAENIAKYLQVLGDTPWWVLGRGSNVLVPDDGLPGAVFVIGRQFSTIEEIQQGNEEDSYHLRVQAGCSLAKLLKFCVSKGYSGLEFAAGIPGSVGGAVRMNAGAWGKEISQCIEQLTIIDRKGNISRIDADEAGFGYRNSNLCEHIVLDAIFIFSAKSQHVIDFSCQQAVRKRMEKQPLQSASAGSFFKNPSSSAAGLLIEKAGLKGMIMGGAKVSGRHANFIVNTGHATAADIYGLMQQVRERVYRNSGIMLEPEVKLLGEWRKK